MNTSGRIQDILRNKQDAESREIGGKTAMNKAMNDRPPSLTTSPGAAAEIEQKVQPIRVLQKFKLRVELGYKFIFSFLMVVIGVLVATWILTRINIPPEWEQFAIVLSAIAMGLAIGRTFTRTLSRDFRQITQSAEVIAEGDLFHPLSLEERMFTDETVDLAEAINTMRNSLRVLVSRIKETLHQVLEASKSLLTSAEGLNTSNKDIASTMEQIAKGASFQAKLVEESSSFLRRMALSIEQATKSAVEARASASIANEAALKGEEIARTTMGKMLGVFEKVEGAHTKVLKFSEKVSQVKKILEIIAVIAEKTDLLALNATIEAARAGEYGRGFSVVAEEVRKLADTSAKSTEQIRQIIETIDVESREVGASISESTLDLRKGREEAIAIIHSLERILASVGETTQRVERIAALYGEHASHAEEAVRSIEEIAKVTEDNVVATEQVAASVQEQRASVSEMSSSVQDLTQMAGDLRDVVARFRLE